MRKPNILLGLTGSVASTLASKLLARLQTLGDVTVIITDRSKSFIDIPSLKGMTLSQRSANQPTEEEACQFFCDSDEWTDEIWHNSDGVLHIKLRSWADILVVAPLSANTLAKFTNGISDNLLTSVFRAWDMSKPCIFAPAMNTLMWQHPVTEPQLLTLKNWFTGWGQNIVMPISKTLACGDVGIGAMADIEDIVKATKAADDYAAEWRYPLYDASGIPVGGHPGAFGYSRTWYVHPGVDLYTNDKQPVFSVQRGRVVGIKPFTGPHCGSAWWLNTFAVLVEGRSGVIVYAEINPSSDLTVGQIVAANEFIGTVTPVLPPEKYRPDVPGHSCSMLHFEMYAKGHYDLLELWELGKPKPDFLIDPTPYLEGADVDVGHTGIQKKLTMGAV